MQTLIKFSLLAAVLALSGLGYIDHALAQDAAEAAAPAPTIDSGDTAWMLTSTALVLLMTIPGLALFYGGMVRKMNVLATVTQSFAITCLVAVLWVLFGYSLAFTNGTPFVGSMSRFLLHGMDMSAPFLLGAGMETGSVQFTIPENVFMMFQMTFAIITPALITGAFVDRMKFSALLVFTTLWLLVVYAPIAHWVWHPLGFLWGAGVLDFAGGTVVHINAGVAGLVAALILGKRAGYGSGGGGHNFAPHNLVLSIIGASLLWVGWFGFNAGSAAAANGRAGMAMTVTMVAAAAAGLSWMMTEWSLRGKPSALGLISGSVAGLVAITPASGFVDPAGAIIIGLAAGVMCYWGATWLKRAGGYDDSLDAFGVHGVGGIVGALLTGVFAIKGIGGVSGLIEGNPGQVMTQIMGIAYTAAWCALATAGILYLIKFTIGLRVEPEQERDGLDLSLHGETVL
ncbi:MAG: ammonium transporter [Alphaproteobacteria bacterium]